MSAVCDPLDNFRITGTKSGRLSGWMPPKSALRGWMPPFEKHIFICCNQREPGHPRGSCDPDADDGLQKAFKQALTDRGLQRRMRANKSGCLDQCEHGPTVVVYPDTVFYGGVSEADIPEIIDRHLLGGEPVERLRLPDECINTTTCPHKPRKKV